MSQDKNLQAYVVGLAIGDGNLSKFPRTARLRVTCSDKYPKLIERIRNAIQELFPQNKVSIVERVENCTDISCYSTQWEELLGWRASDGSKVKQLVRVPEWIKDDVSYAKQCLKGLIETDGCIYIDRGYKMVNFVTAIEGLAHDVGEMIKFIGFKPNIQEIHRPNMQKYTIRISKRTQEFIDLIDLHKD
jgi:hypothetical protein